jgi:Xaa-Pro aminopeptidase
VHGRRRRLPALAETDCVVITAPVDLFYLTGLDLSAGMLAVSTSHEMLFVDGRYFTAARAVKELEVELGSQEALGNWLQHHQIERCAFDASTTTVAKWEQLRTIPEVQWEPRPHLGQRLRMVKEAGEFEALRDAAALAIEGFDFLCNQLIEGVTERELATQLEIFWLQRGGERVSFEPIIAFGSHAALPHHRPSTRPLRSGEVVLCDLGVQKEHYQSDLTRVVFFGPEEPQMRTIYTIVQEAFEVAVKSCRAGVRVGDLDRATREVIEKAGYGAAFTHSLGHGVGLEVHEMPFLRSKPPESELILQSGMVVTLEPAIYLPHLGGIRLEDTVIVGQEGCELLTWKA